MTKEQIIDAAALYLAYLVGKGAEPVRMANLSEKNAFGLPRTEVVRNHLAWMCDLTIKMADAGDHEKAVRWLCFVQGCLYMMGDYSIDEFRTHNGVREIP